MAHAGAPRARLSWNDPRVRGLFWQAVVLGIVGVVVWYLASNTQANLESRRIATGFSFLEREAGFAIGESMAAYTPADSYGRAILIGLLNTLRVAVVGVILATILGTLIGIARLSRNWLIARLASGYVEVVRNLPLLLQLFFWYSIITETLPGTRSALNPMPGVFISNRGIKYPSFAEHTGYDLMWIGLLLGFIASFFLRAWARRRQARTGQAFPAIWGSIALTLGTAIVFWLAGGAPTALDVPELRGFNFSGGSTLTPEFTALLLGLVIYTAGFIAEIVRSGIQAVSKGQTEAAMALGLSNTQNLRLVLLPQALRVIVPPMTSQYLNITKNSSLAIAIGYPDIVSVSQTTLNQTGQAIEGIAIIMAAFLTVSLGISLVMNWYNRRIALKER